MEFKILGLNILSFVFNVNPNSGDFHITGIVIEMVTGFLQRVSEQITLLVLLLPWKASLLPQADKELLRV